MWRRGPAWAPGVFGRLQDIRRFEGPERTPSLNPQKGFHVRSPGRQHVSDCPDCRFSLAPQDLVEPDGNGDMPNLSFYKNEMAFLPNGVFLPGCQQLPPGGPLHSTWGHGTCLDM